MMAAHGSATTVFETVVPSTPAHDTEISCAKGRPLGGGLENRRSATLNKVEAYRYYGLGDRCHHLREYFICSNQASATRKLF